VDSPAHAAFHAVYMFVQSAAVNIVGNSATKDRSPWKFHFAAPPLVPSMNPPMLSETMPCGMKTPDDPPW
jgi:hypothetical protein